MPQDGVRDRDDQFAIDLLRRAGQCASAIFQRELSGGLTPRQFLVLQTVAEREGLSQAHLVESTGIDRSTLADIIRRLARRGWIQRQRTREDYRAYAVRLTEEGRSVLSTAEPLARRAEDKFMAALETADREPFTHGLAEIIRSYDGRYE